MPKSLWPKFWNSLNDGDINWDIFYKLNNEERKEAANWLIKRDFVLSSSERVENMSLTSECNALKKYVIKYERGRILNPANSANLQETLYFRKEEYAEQYMSYLRRTSLKKSLLILEAKELNSSLVNAMRTRDWIFDFHGESPNHPSY